MIQVANTACYMLFHLPYFVAHGVYSNSVGFWSGVTCALLVAKVCKTNPHNDAVQNLKEFFAQFAHWYAISMSCFEYITVGTMNVI